MLNDEQIENILYPYAKRQEEFSLSVINIIANRISRLADFDKLDPLNKVATMQRDIRLIEDEYNSFRRDQKKRIKKDWWWIVEYIYGEGLLFYETQLALAQNEEIIELTNRMINEAQGSFTALTDSPVITMRSLSNPSYMQNYNLQSAYRSVINEARSYSNVSENLFDVAMQKTESQLFDSGVRYEVNGNSQSAVRAVRFNVLESIKNLIQRVQDTMGKQFGADGVELSAHVAPAPDHAPAQGHQFTFENRDKMQSGEDFEDIQGNHYIGFERQIYQYNCRHYFMNIKIGKKEPEYTQEQLDKILEDNERGYTTPRGKHYTLYECSQIQRRYERKIRQAKEKYLFSKSLGKQADMFTSRNRVGSLTTQYKQFSRLCGLPAKLERIRVKDY